MANGVKVVWETRQSWRRTSDQGFVRIDRLNCRAQMYMLYGAMGGNDIIVRRLSCNLINAIRVAESLITRSVPDSQGWVYTLQRVGSVVGANPAYFAVIDANKLNWFVLADTGVLANGDFVSIADAVKEAESALIKAHKNYTQKGGAA